MQRLGQLLDFLVQLVLDLLGLFLLEEDLVLVVDLSLGQALVALVTHISQPLLEPDLLRVVELFEVSELLLRSLIDLIDSVLELLFSLLKLVFELSDLLL